MNETPIINLSDETNGFLSLFNSGFITARGPIGLAVCQGEVYKFSLFKWKEMFDNADHRLTYGEWQQMICEFREPNLTPSDVETRWNEYQQEAEQKSIAKSKHRELIVKHQAEYLNACDDLYYGYGYNFWRNHNNHITNDDDARIVWQMAVEKMSK